MADQRSILIELAGHLEAAAGLVRHLADEDSGTPPDVPVPTPPNLDPGQWLTLAEQIHPALGERQAQVLGEVVKAHPDGVGTGPIWRAIGYEQTNTYLVLDALARHGLVRKDDSSKPHKYYLGERLLAYAKRQS